MRRKKRAGGDTAESLLQEFAAWQLRLAQLREAGGLDVVLAGEIARHLRAAADQLTAAAPAPEAAPKADPPGAPQLCACGQPARPLGRQAGGSSPVWYAP